MGSRRASRSAAEASHHQSSHTHTQSSGHKSQQPTIVVQTMKIMLATTATLVVATAFQTQPINLIQTHRLPQTKLCAITDDYSFKRRSLIMLMASGGSSGGLFSNFFGSKDNAANASIGGSINSGKGTTNEVIKTVNGMRQRRLGGSDICVSEVINACWFSLPCMMY